MRADGFSYEFDPSFCESCGGKCCTGESGYIWIDEGEILKFCAAFGMSKDEFESKFLIRVGLKRSIKEKPYDDGFACIFFDEKNKNCSVYELRPKQCRTFPFWDYFKKNLKELRAECIGVKF